MQKRLFLILMLSVLFLLPTHAVLKERNIEGTLAMLRIELTEQHHRLERQSSLMKKQRMEVMTDLITAMNRSQQNAMMLYSQKNGYVFDLTYACHEATEQYHNFKTNVAPFRTYVQNADGEIARFDSLINDLSSMYIQALPEKSKIDRNVCLTLAVNIRRTLNYNRQQMKQYIDMYNMTESRLKNLNDYAIKRYGDIQASIFTNGNADYLKILMNLSHEVKETTETVIDKYRPQKKYMSDWDSRVILGLAVVLLIIGVLAAAASYFIIGFIVTQLLKLNKADFILKWLFGQERNKAAKEDFKAKRFCIILTFTVISFAIILGIVRVSWSQNFIIMACGLLVEYAWLMGVILLSLLIRLNGDQIRHGFRIYSPIMAMCFIVISFRIILIPNDLVELIFPPILIACTVWQWLTIRRNKATLPSSDVFYAYVSLIAFLASDVASFIGYTLLSVEMLIWWTMQLTCILTITCVSTMLKKYGNNPKRQFFSGDAPIGRTWLFQLVYTAVLPILGALSILISIYWAADVFNLSDTCWMIFNTPLVKSTKITFSIIRAVQAVVLFFLFYYVNKVSIQALHAHLMNRERRKAAEEKRKPSPQVVTSRIAMWKNFIQVFIWGLWILITLAIFNIDNSWIVAISAGLSTGIGFAMKDILENIYYGISLMAGRIKVGDYISIEGTRGTVTSISYTSTTLEALDGSVIAFQNAQLFTKNYKNLTRNHGNELAIIPVGVAYGSKVPQVKEIIGNAVESINKTNYIKFIKVIFTGFGDNSIDFKILAWVDSRKQVYAESDILEVVYNALNDANIEIPYPQRDVHIVSDTAHQVQHADSLDEAEKMIFKDKKA